MSSQRKGRGGKINPRNPPIRNVPESSAEYLSYMNRLAISEYPNSWRMDPDLDPGTVVTTEIWESLMSSKPKAKPKAKQLTTIHEAPSPPKEKKDRIVNGPAKGVASVKAKSKKKTPVETDDLMERVLQSIGSLLTPRSEVFRQKVLTKLNGTFGFKLNEQTKSKPTSSKKKKKKPTEAKPKSDFNTSYAKTLEGQLLEKTSKLQKISAAKSDSPILCSTLYKFHKFLLAKRSEVKRGKAKLIPYNDSAHDPEDLLKTLAWNVDKELSMREPEEQTKLLDSIFESGLCLIRGSESSTFSYQDWQSLDETARTQISLTVPRTDEEKKAKADLLMAAKQQKRKASAFTADAPSAGGESASEDASVDPTDPPEEETESMVHDSKPESKRPRLEEPEMDQS